MKACPFCKEQINDDAIKCRFCQSMLLAVHEPKDDAGHGGRVTYVLDKDLIRFAKFSVAVLAVFIVIGASLFGVKLESALEKVRDSQEQLKTAHEKLGAAQRDLEAAQTTVKTLKRDVETVLAEARSNLGVISEHKTAAMELVISMRELNPMQTAALSKVRAEKSAKVRPDQVRYWANGTTLRVAFLDGTEGSRAVVKDAAAEWGKYANIKFQFVLGTDAEVRVSFADQGNWSYLGTDALVVGRSQATVNLETPTKAVALHEFGHVLGLIEEHQNPKAAIKWNKQVVYKALRNSFDAAMVDRQVFDRMPQAQIGSYREFDPKSIMTRAFPSEWTGGVAIGGAQELSASDKALIARIYPKL